MAEPWGITGEDIMPRGKAIRIDAETFIKTYLKHDNNQSVCKELGMSMPTVLTRASKLRKVGVRLPYRNAIFMPLDSRPTFVEEMNELIKAVEGFHQVNGLVPPDSETTTDSSNSPSEATQERKEALDE